MTAELDFLGQLNDALASMIHWVDTETELASEHDGKD